MAAENSGHSGRPAPFGSLQQFTYHSLCQRLFSGAVKRGMGGGRPPSKNSAPVAPNEVYDEA